MPDPWTAHGCVLWIFFWVGILYFIALAPPYLYNLIHGAIYGP